MTAAYTPDCSMCSAGNCTDRLHSALQQARADMERLETERDSLRSDLRVGVDFWEEYRQAEAQRDEAAGLLRARCDDHDLPVVDDESHPNGTLKYHDIGATAKQRGHSDNYPDGLLAICDLTDDERTFLVSLKKHN